MRLTERLANITVAAIHGDYGIAFALGGRKRLRCGFLGVQRGSEIAARSVGAAQCVFKARRVDIGIRKFVGQFKLLPERQADGATQREFRDGKVVACDAEVVLLGVQLNFRARGIDPWSSPRLELHPLPGRIALSHFAPVPLAHRCGSCPR